MRLVSALAVGLAACHDPLSVGAPDDAGLDAPVDAADAAPPPSCATGTGPELVTTLDPALGTVVAVAADEGEIYVATVAPGTAALSLFSAAKGAGTHLVANVGVSPGYLALDRSDVYVATSGSNEVIRVPRDGTPATSIIGELSPGPIVTDGWGGAFWVVVDTSASGWAVHGSARGASSSQPVAIGIAHPTVLASDGTRLFAEGQNEVTAVSSPLMNPKVSPLASRCDGALLAFASEGQAVLCSEGATLVRVALDGTGATVLTNLPGNVRELVVGGGRAFVRLEPRAGTHDTALIMAVPLDGVGGPTLVPVTRTATNLATDRCFLYFLDGQNLDRFGL